MTVTTESPGGLAKGQLSTIDCIAQSLAVGPVFSGALLGGILAGLSGGVGTFVIVLTAIGILAIGRIVSEFAKRLSGAGTVYEFIAKSLGNRAAVFAAGSYHTAVIALAGPAIGITGGLLVRDFFNAHMGLDLPWWVWSLIVLAVLAAVNLVGVKVSVKAQLGLIAASILPFLILFVKVVADGGPTGNNLKSLNPGNVADGGSVFKGLLFAILMFVGFELSAALGEETKDPTRSIPRAVLATVGITAVFYLITQYTFAIGSTSDLVDFASMADHYLGRFFSIWIELAVILDVIAVGIGFQLAASRGLFSLARDGVLPATLARTNARKQPIGGVVAFSAVAVISVLVALAKYGTGLVDPAGPDLFFNAKAFNGSLAASIIGAMLICMVYALVCLGGLKRFAMKSPIDLIAAIVGLATCVLGVAAQFIEGTKPAPALLWSRTLGIILAVLLAVWAGVTKKSVIDRVAQHATVHE